MADRIRGPRRAGTPPAAAEGRTPDGPDSPDGAAADADAAAASGPPDYAVGYGRPPTHTRFRKGRSGNPAGRPKGGRGLAALLAAELRKPVAVREAGRLRRISKLEALVAGLVNKALQGDGRARAELVELVQREEAERRRADAAAPGARAEEEPLAASDQAIIEAFRRRAQATADAAEGEDGGGGAGGEEGGADG
jgi:Family of unknown function (DUF5681)